MARRTVPAWALAHLDGLPPTSPVVNVYRHRRGVVVANTVDGAAVVTKRAFRAPRLQFLPHPRQRLNVSCTCGTRVEFRHSELPATAHCPSCGAALPMAAPGAAAPAPEEARCQARTASGVRCRLAATAGATTCGAHAPGRSQAAWAKEALETARRRSGPGGIRAALHEAVRAVPLAPPGDLEAMKRTFINSAAHELRTPMTPLLLSLHALESNADGAGRPAVQQAVRSAKRLEDVIGRLLQVAQLQAAPLRAHVAPTDVAALVAAAVASWQARADAAGVSLRARTPVRLRLACDGARVREMLDHLLSNAIRFTPAGGRVRVTAVRKGRAVEVAVADTGPGIPAADRERVLEPFVQLGNAAQQTQGGLGLGLFFAAAVAKAHGGDLRVADGRKGARLVARLPPPAPHSPHPSSPPRRTTRSRRT
ncbi:MAG: sensor histidine kinase [Thermoplasmatota archaeon]